MEGTVAKHGVLQKGPWLSVETHSRDCGPYPEIDMVKIKRCQYISDQKVSALDK